MMPYCMYFVVSGPSVTELSRMFPTPPSLENQQNALSPCQAADMTDITAVYAMPPTVMTDVDSSRTEAFHSTTKTGHSEVGPCYSAFEYCYCGC